MGRKKGEELVKKTYRLKPASIADISKLAEENKVTDNTMANIIVEEGIKAVKRRVK